jgi:hypothetical protein
MQTMTNEEINRSTGYSKVKQYGWGLKDSPGDLMWISKNELLIDHSYQRHASRDRVMRIAGNWSWLACGVIVVAKRETDQRFYVVEGQHRVAAALKRSDIDRMPCIVFKTESAKQEAAGFYDANTARKLPTTLEKWRAQLMRGDATTIFVDSLIRQAGRVPNGQAGPGEVRCLTALLNAANADRERLVQMWPLIVEVCQGQVLHERVFEGLMWLEARLPKGESLTDRRWRERVTRVGYAELLDAAQRAATFYARGGYKVWGLGQLEALNKGCRIRIVLSEDDK